MSELPIIVFDVNETLLDLETLQPTFDRIFHDPAAMRMWFANLITYSEALTLAGVYVPFTEIGGAVLRMLAATRDITISDTDAAELTDRFATMAPHPEVPAALRRLRDHGFRLFTLTDNTLEISGRQLEAAGVIDVFERRFSVDQTVRRHKPCPGGLPLRRRRAASRPGRHLPDRVPRLGHHRCPGGGVAGRAHPAPGQRSARRGPAAELYRPGPRCGRRPADRAVRRRGEYEPISAISQR